MQRAVHEVHAGERQVHPVSAQRTRGRDLALVCVRGHRRRGARVLVAWWQAGVEQGVAEAVARQEHATRRAIQDRPLFLSR